MVEVLGRQRFLKVASAVVVSLLSGGAAWGMTAATASSHASRVHPSEIDGSTTTSVDETSSTESTTTESTTTSDPSTTTESTTTTTTTTLDTTAPTTTCNHGADVSKVAHEAPRGHGSEHGKLVSAAAHQKCNGADDAGDQPEATTGTNDKHPDKSDHEQESGGD